MAAAIGRESACECAVTFNGYYRFISPALVRRV